MCIETLFSLSQAIIYDLSSSLQRNTAPRAPQQVTMLNSSKVVELKVNTSVKIYCESNTNMSASEISWKFNGDPLPQTAEVAGNMSVLMINILSFDQSGNYSCGFDQGNELWENVSITVGRKPQPVRNLTCIEQPDFNFNCSWLSSKIATNLKTTYKYRKLKWDSGHGFDHWEDVENSCIDIKNDKMKRIFSVKASNVLGDSEMVNTTFNITIPPPVVFGTFFNNETMLYVNWTISNPKLSHFIRLLWYRDTFPKPENWTEKGILFMKLYEIEVGAGYSEYEIKVAVTHKESDQVVWSKPLLVLKHETRPKGNVSGNCRWSQEQSNHMICSWDALPIDQHNGRLRGYHVSVFRKDGKNKNVREANISNEVLNAEFEGLPMKYNYTVNINAYNSAGSTTILSLSVGRQHPGGLALGYIVSIVCTSILMLFLITLLLVRCIKKADFMKPLPEPKYFYSSEWGTLGCAEKHHSEVETFNELKSRNMANEKGDQSERTVMLPQKGFEVNEDSCVADDQQTKPVMEVTNLTYLILGRKQEQQNNNISHPDLNEDDLQKMNSSEENSDDTNVCYLRLRNGNLLTQVQNHDNASEVMPDDPNSLSINPLPITVSPVQNSEEAYDSMLSSEGYVSGSGTSCLTAYTQLSTN
ncbi:uncharacterized protein LOC117121830 [Anneissia japonica]|uniref:uncharacterized protein LOC117121830 n=1 Tax=Anneissia japonica TaxID=1529436 RepID=UPI00142584DA|nr:uncharacterized protein LOC117121830 [Anneissia japonica]